MLVRSAQAYNYSRKAGRARGKGTIIKTRSFFSRYLFFRYCEFGPSRAYHKET